MVRRSRKGNTMGVPSDHNDRHRGAPDHPQQDGDRHHQRRRPAGELLRRSDEAPRRHRCGVGPPRHGRLLPATPGRLSEVTNEALARPSPRRGRLGPRRVASIPPVDPCRTAPPTRGRARTRGPRGSVDAEAFSASLSTFRVMDAGSGWGDSLTRRPVGPWAGRCGQGGGPARQGPSGHVPDVLRRYLADYYVYVPWW